MKDVQGRKERALERHISDFNKAISCNDIRKAEHIWDYSISGTAKNLGKFDEVRSGLKEGLAYIRKSKIKKVEEKEKEEKVGHTDY